MDTMFNNYDNLLFRQITSRNMLNTRR